MILLVIGTYLFGRGYKNKVERKNEKHETLEMALKELIRHVRIIADMEKEIDEKWGVRLVTGYIPSNIDKAKGDINVRRGIEAVAEALGEEVKFSSYSRYTKELRHRGIQFMQYADDRTKTFVKAGCEPPKVQIVED